MLIEVLLIIVIVLLVLIYTNKSSDNIESSIAKILNDSGLYMKIGELTTHAQNLTSQARDINETLDRRVGDMNKTLDEKVGELTIQTEDIRNSHKSVEQMLRIPKERAPIGEISLETILSDQLPPDMFGIRQKILDGKIPDAYIKSTVGLICIDSKFPLDNYVKMVETKDSIEKEVFKLRFIKDVQGHLEKISTSYINPQRGSAEFSFAYIPSEGIYYFLINDAYEMLRDYAKKGVQVTSPLILTSKIELVKTGVFAKKLSEDTEKVRNDIARLSDQFKDLDESWRIFYSTHFSRATIKAEDVDQKYKRLRGEFGRISIFANKQVIVKQYTQKLSDQLPVTNALQTPITVVKDIDIKDNNINKSGICPICHKGGILHETDAGKMCGKCKTMYNLPKD